MWPRTRKFAANLVIAGFLGLSLIDATPSTSPAYQSLKEWIDPALDATGLWQESWQLFAPSPKTINPTITATMRFADGSSYIWESPRWGELTPWQKFGQVRHMKFYDRLRLNAYSSAWGPFIDYRVRQRPTVHFDKKVVRVELRRHWTVVPDPLDGAWNWLGDGRVPRQEYLMSTKYYRLLPMMTALPNLRGFGESWDRFFFRQVDVRICGAFRIGFALLLLANSLGYYAYLDQWFGGSGVLPFDASRLVVDPDTLTIFAWLPEKATTLWICYGIFNAQILALLIGFHSRIQAICLFAWLVSFSIATN